MLSDYNFREASIEDADFLAEAIIEAEKSGTEILSYTTIFGLSEADAKKLIVDMLKEEVDGCDISISSFLVAERDDGPVAALSIWQEGNEGISSTVLKGNLLGYYLSGEAIEKAMAVSSITSELAIEPIPGSLVIGAGYVNPKHRGQGLLKKLTELHIEKAMKNKVPPKEIYTQIFAHNAPPIKTNEKLGFRIVATYHSNSKEIVKLLPSDTKVLMMKKL